jgi:hypothetical protein
MNNHMFSLSARLSVSALEKQKNEKIIARALDAPKKAI